MILHCEWCSSFQLSTYGKRVVYEWLSSFPALEEALCAVPIRIPRCVSGRVFTDGWLIGKNVAISSGALCLKPDCGPWSRQCRPIRHGIALLAHKMWVVDCSENSVAEVKSSIKQQIITKFEKQAYKIAVPIIYETQNSFVSTWSPFRNNYMEFETIDFHNDED